MGELSTCLRKPISTPRFLTKHLGDEYLVRCQLPLSAADDQQPEPDFAVLRGKVEELKDHPATALLVIEVSFDSLKRDKDKAAVYAQAGVAEYWIVNLNARQLLQHTLPKPTPSVGIQPAALYASIRTFSMQETVTCTVLPLPVRKVEELLPPFWPD